MNGVPMITQLAVHTDVAIGIILAIGVPTSITSMIGNMVITEGTKKFKPTFPRRSAK